jgi:hypothetical protein
VMSTNKATNEEGFQAKFFKHGLRALDYHLANLFNHVVYTGFSQAWSHHTIYLIHKSGPSPNPNNYKTVNLGKTKVMIFNGSKKVLLDHHFLFRKGEIQSTSTYTYLEIQFSGPHFSLQHVLQPHVNKGYASLAALERQRFWHCFQDIPSKMSLMDSLIQAHSSLWLRGLGALFTRGRLGFS